MSIIDKTEILCFLPYPKDSVPGQRFRWEQWEEKLKKKKIELKIIYFSDLDLFKIKSKSLMFIKYLYLYFKLFLKVFKNLRYKNVLFFRNFTIIGPPIIEILFWSIGKNIIFDFDDAVYLGSEKKESWFIKFFFRCDWKINFILKISNLVICGNKILYSYAKKYNQKCFIIPTSVDLSKYKISKKKNFLKKRQFTVGWSGSKSTAKYIKVFLPELLRLQKKLFFKVLIIGSGLNINNNYIHCIPWNPKTEVKDLLKLDVGLMPLPDSPWTRGKCGLKIIQYLSLGIPSIASDVGINSLILKNNFNGFLVKKKDKWIYFLRRIILDRKFYTKIKKNCRKSVSNYSSEVVCNNLNNIFIKYLK